MSQDGTSLVNFRFGMVFFWFRGWDTSHPNLGNVKDNERIARDNEIDGRMMGTKMMVE